MTQPHALDPVDGWADLASFDHDPALLVATPGPRRRLFVFEAPETVVGAQVTVHRRSGFEAATGR